MAPTVALSTCEIKDVKDHRLAPHVQAEVIQYFQFRRADRHVDDILAAALDETWVLLAKRGDADDMYRPAAMTRLQNEREKAFALATAPLERFRLLLDYRLNHPGRDRFKSPGSAQRFLSAHAIVQNTFNVQRHLVSRNTLRALRGEALQNWQAATAGGTRAESF
jgi:hypothetical protein